MIYLDNAATTPVRREVLEAMWPYLTNDFGNSSSHHALGDRAREALHNARATVAAFLHCRASEVIFTSGGTESDNFAIKGIALANPRGKHIVTTPIEHEAVLATCDYLQRHHDFEITHVPVDRYGLIRMDSYEAALRFDTTLCTIMLANNEVGTVQPIVALAEAARSRGIPFHTDAVQAAAALPVDVRMLGADAMSLSGHKVGALKGVGVLFLRGSIQAEPLLHGGGQERGRRSGTENVAGAVGFARALELAEADRDARMRHVSAMRDDLVRGILAEVPGAMLTGHPTQRLPGNASFCFPGTSGESILLHLAERGIVCSSGSACAAGSDEPSHVLIAMGIAREVAQTAVRGTLNDSITPEQIAQTVRATRAAAAAVLAIAH